MRIQTLLAGAAMALVASAAAVSASAAELVTNGGFETGTFAGWSQFDNTGFTGIAQNFNAIDPTEGSFQSYYGPVGATGGITQTIATQAGGHYTFSFDLYGFPGGDFYAAAFNGVTLLSGAGSTGFYGSHSFNVVATGDSSALTFTFQHGPSYYLLDNVSVTTGAVPEPGAWALMLTGFLGAGVALRSNRRRQAAVAA